MPTLSLKPFLTITPLSSAAHSALSYVPFVILSRLLSPIRFFLVAKILGDLGQREYGLYQPALELINWIVPLVMFGLADVAERYAARFQKEHRLAAALKQQYTRLASIALPISLLMLATAPWISRAISGAPQPAETRFHQLNIIAACALTITCLAFYQHLAATLRGLRAYTAVAGMETLSSLLLLILSCLAAYFGAASALIYMYALSLLIPLLLYGSILLTHLKTIAIPETPLPPPNRAGLNHFAAWALVRLMLVMTFGFLSVWGVRFLSARIANPDPNFPLNQTANYAASYRIAQLLAYLAVTLWASSYGIAATAWSHGQLRRARTQLFRVGKFGAVLISLLAVALLLSRSLFAALFPLAYSDSLLTLLPQLLALFIWFGLLSFASTYSDLRETPNRGAWLWGAAVVIQLALLLAPEALFQTTDPKLHVLLASSIGLAASLFLLAPLLLWHPFKLSATAVPLVLLALAPLSLFSPPYIVDYLAPPVILGIIGFLYLANLLLRPIDRRSLRRLRKKSL